MNIDTLLLKKQITFYYVYVALIGTWFTSGIALFFNRNYLTDTSIGFIEAIAFGIGLLAEIPSGAIADIFGRRRTVMSGIVLSALGFGIWGLSVAGWMVFVGVLLFSVGTALQSGADEAMMYDYIKAHGREDMWPRISATGGIIARLSYVISIFIGGIAYIYYDRLPFLMRSLTFLVMLIPLIKLAVIDRFQNVQHKENQSRHYINDLKNGIKELFYSKVNWLVPLFIMVQGVSYTMFTAGILRPLLYEKSGLPVAYHSSAISVALILTVVTMFVIRYYESKIVTKSVVYLFAATCAAGFAVTIGHLPVMLSLAGLMMVQVASYSLMPLLSTVLNKNISSRYRATTLSTASFMQSIGYVVAAPIIGFLSAQGFINEVAIGATLVVAAGVVLSFILSASNQTSSTS